MAFAPVDTLRHRMSSARSPLKSPTPATLHAVASVATAVVAVFRPLRQIAFAPVVVLRHSRSARPSLLKSPTPTMRHGPVWVATAIVVAEFPLRQITSAPVVSLRQAMSARPSASKSPTPTTRNCRLLTAVTAVCVAELAERQITFAPVLMLRHAVLVIAVTDCTVGEYAERQRVFAPLVLLRHGTSERPSLLKSACARYAPMPAVQVLLHMSPAAVLPPSSHCSRPSVRLLPQVAASTWPSMPALLRGASAPKRKSLALLPVSSVASRVVAPPEMFSRRNAARVDDRPVAG